MAKFATNASGAIWWPNLLLMQVAPSGGQICNYCKWRHLMAIFATNASGTIWWPNLQLMQVAPSGGQICKFALMLSGRIPDVVPADVDGVE